MLTLLPLALAAAASLAPADRFAVRAAEVHVGDGTVLKNATILVMDGQFRAIAGDIEIPAGVPLLEHDGVLTPGLVACRSFDGVAGDVFDDTRPALPEARVAYAFAPESKDLERELQAGVTTLVLAPDSRSLVGGRTAVVKTANGKVLAEDGHLALGLSRSSLRDDQFPTSYAGAISALEESFAGGEGPFARASSGELPVLIDARSEMEILRAARFAQEHGLKGALVGANRVEPVLDAVRASGLAAVFGPFPPGTSTRNLRAALAFAEAGLPFGFAVNAPSYSPDHLRFSAALCVRAGMDPDRARAALTSGGARIAGVGDRVGRIARGLDADFVLWSGDPLDLKSTVEAVFVDGERVYERPAEEGDAQ